MVSLARLQALPTAAVKVRVVGSIVVLLGLLLTAACAEPVRGGCPVSVPNGSTPPGESASEMFHGENGVWTVLWPDGVVAFKPDGPGEVRSDGSLAMKFSWWRAEGVEGELRISGRRLEGAGQSLAAEIPLGYGLSGFQASALVFPSEGCWEVTAQAGEARLSFVTQVSLLTTTG